jgi:hypothetical protein
VKGYVLIMDTFMTDYWPYVVGLALTLSIYFVMFTVMPFLFRKAVGSKPAQTIKTSKAVAAVANVVKPKPVFPFEFCEVAGESAMAAFEAAKIEGKGIPVIIGGGEGERMSLADMMQYRNLTEYYLREADAKPDPYASKAKPRMPKDWVKAGPFPRDDHPFLVKNFNEGFKPVVTLAYIPAASSAEIPAHLKLGSWNAVPDANVFVALLRKWQRDYGAELVALRVDCMDIRVTRKPATREEALSLAREHLKFCATGATIAEAAAELMETKWWHFYWD